MKVPSDVSDVVPFNYKIPQDNYKKRKKSKDTRRKERFPIKRYNITKTT